MAREKRRAQIETINGPSKPYVLGDSVVEYVIPG